MTTASSSAGYQDSAAGESSNSSASASGNGCNLAGCTHNFATAQGSFRAHATDVESSSGADSRALGSSTGPGTATALNETFVSAPTEFEGSFSGGFSRSSASASGDGCNWVGCANNNRSGVAQGALEAHATNAETSVKGASGAFASATGTGTASASNTTAAHSNTPRGNSTTSSGTSTSSTTAFGGQ
jgi:hypothetical protein